MQNFKYKIYDIFYDFKIYIFFDLVQDLFGPNRFGMRGLVRP